MNGAAGWLVAGPGVWAIGVIYSDGLTQKSLSALGVALILMLLAVRYQGTINRWWERLETRLVSSAPPRRTRVLASRVRRFRIASAILALPVVFLLGAATGRTLSDDESRLPSQPVTSSALGPVNLELWALNASTGENEYAREVSAKVDEVVQVQLTYVNRGLTDASIAVRPSLSEPIDGQQLVRIEVEIEGQRDALAIPVDLSLGRASLSFLTDKTMVRTTDGADSAPNDFFLPDGAGRLVEVDLIPSGGSGSVVFFARSQASVVTINLLGSSEVHPEPAAYLNAHPSAEVLFELVVGNAGNVPLRDVTLRANLPPGMRQIPGSTEINRGRSWQLVGDELVGRASPVNGAPAGRLRVGDIGVGEHIRLRWKVQLSDETAHVSCVIGVVRAVGLSEYYNTAAVGVPDVPSSCNGGN